MTEHTPCGSPTCREVPAHCATCGARWPCRLAPRTQATPEAGTGPASTSEHVAGFPRCFECHRRSRWVVENVTGTKRFTACPKHVHAALEALGGPHRVVSGAQRIAQATPEPAKQARPSEVLANAQATPKPSEVAGGDVFLSSEDFLASLDDPNPIAADGGDPS